MRLYGAIGNAPMDLLFGEEYFKKMIVLTTFKSKQSF